MQIELYKRKMRFRKKIEIALWLNDLKKEKKFIKIRRQ
jgi:hypothetical protein